MTRHFLSMRYKLIKKSLSAFFRIQTNYFPIGHFNRSWINTNKKEEVIMEVTVPKDLSATITLNDGNVMPMYGLGVYQAQSGEGKEAEKAVQYAIQNGYRLIDTAQFYGNEEDVGRAIKNSDVPRDQLFIVTKLWEKGYDSCKKTFAESLKKLDLDYVDLFLIHNPLGGKNLESYDAMIELQKQGLIKSIGVSNYNTYHLEEFKKAGKPTPAVNQIELHPYCQQKNITDYCRQEGIAVMGFTPLTRGIKFQDPPLVETAKKHDKTVTQILLRWSIQHGYITIPKSTSPKRILENLDIYNFELTKEDIETMNKFPEQVCTKASTNYPWLG